VIQRAIEERVPVSIVRTRAAIKRAVKNHGSIFAENAENTDMDDVFEEIAMEVTESNVS
jgi:hypothetical protein